MQHIKLLLSVITAMSGIYVTIYINNVRRRYRFSYLTKLVIYMLIISVLFSIMMFAIYFKLNLPGDFLLNRSSMAGIIVNLAVYSLIFILMYLMFLIAMDISGGRASRAGKIILITFLLLALLIECLNIFFPETFKTLKILNIVYEYLIDNLVFLEIFFLLYVVRKGSKMSDGRRKRVVMSFGYLFLLRYLILIAGYIAFALKGFSGNMIFISQILVLFSIILLPYLWVNIYFLKYVENLEREADIEPHLENICRNYGVSSREKEIIILMIRGKTNKEIEDQLFISINTVKNHVYNIFKKLKINSRHQLIKFFTEF